MNTRNQISPFAALGGGIQKQAFVQGLKDLGNGAWNYAAGKLNASEANSWKSLNSTKAGLSGFASGGFHGAGQAADKSWNQDTANAKQQSARGDAGWNQMAGSFGTMGKGIGNYFGGIGRAIAGQPTQPQAPAAPTPAAAPAPTAAAPAPVVKAAMGFYPSASGAPMTSSATPAAPKPAATPAPGQGFRLAGLFGGKPSAAPVSLGGSPAAQTGQVAPPRPQFARRGGASPSGVTGRLSTGASPSAPPEVRNQVAAQAGVKPIMPDQVEAAKATPAGPTPEQLAQFQKGTASKFDPNSKLDRAKMQFLMSGEKNWASNQGGRAAMNSGGSAIAAYPKAPVVKSAFSMLEKQAANGLAGLVQKGVGAAGKFLRGSARQAKSTAGRAAIAPSPHMLGNMDEATKLRAFQEASAGAGKLRSSLGQKLGRGAKSIEASKGIQNTINYGGGTALAGAGLYGANRMGHSSGRKDGISEGFDGGVQTGIERAQANMDPGGFFGMGQGGINTGNAYGSIAQDREALIKAIMQRAGA